MIDKAIFCLCKQLASIHHTVIKPWINFKKRTRSQAKALVITFRRQRQITDQQTNLVVVPYELLQEPVAAAAFPHPSSSSLRPSCRHLFPSSFFQSQDLPSRFQSQDLRLRPIDPDASALAHLNKIPRESQGLQFRKSSLLKLQEEKLLSEPFSRWDWPPAFPLLSSVTDPSNSTSVETLSSSSSCSLLFATSCCSPSAAASIAKIWCEKTAKVNDRCKTLIKINNLVDSMNAYLESNQHISCQDTWKPWESNLFVQNSKAQELSPKLSNFFPAVQHYVRTYLHPTF